ncbi:MAG TPA: HAD-IA family hydrolase, partial [Nitrospiria bacterium]|nr:HAD-IA family hydrolase [Nitrospiria bacterium]
TAFMKQYEQHLMDRTVFFPHGREILDHFADKKKAVLSNKPERFIRLILEELGSLECFDAIAGGDTYDKKKPDPMGLLDLMKKLDVIPERTLMIGDSQVDIDTGRAAGVKTCGVTFGHATREEMAALKPDWMVDDMTELKKLFM